jgi:hypothetical protein
MYDSSRCTVFPRSTHHHHLSQPTTTHYSDVVMKLDWVSLSILYGLIIFLTLSENHAFQPVHQNGKPLVQKGAVSNRKGKVSPRRSKPQASKPFLPRSSKNSLQLSSKNIRTFTQSASKSPFIQQEDVAKKTLPSGSILSQINTHKTILGTTVIPCRRFSLGTQKTFDFLGSFSSGKKLPKFALPEIGVIGKCHALPFYFPFIVTSLN